MKRIISALALVLTIGAGSAFAQNPPPAAQAPAPAAQSPAPATGAATDKKAISHACSQQADAKGLKGKPRKKFRSACKKNGGKSPS
ncbi:MAG TPA: PsiF family protein [Xanthobacteraceae bacterium]|nr:PsiF family protein [Xanthobacteraceae bacterium]